MDLDLASEKGIVNILYDSNHYQVNPLLFTVGVDLGNVRCRA